MGMFLAVIMLSAFTQKNNLTLSNKKYFEISLRDTSG